jgi:drug/metabolite transporter (DMT)-like permease
MKAGPILRVGPLAITATTVGVLAAICTAASYGAASYVASQIVNNPAPALVIVSYETFFGLVYISLLRFRVLIGARPVRRSGLLWAMLSGVAFAVGIGSFYTSLSHVPLSVAAPLVGATPLAAYALVLIMLRGSEQVTRRALLGASMVVAGVALIGICNS